MLKRIFLLLYLIIIPCIANASIWDAILGAEDFSETWNGRTNTYTDYTFLPPYNKQSGRDGCLKKYSPPGAMEIFYLKYCGEIAPSTSYFAPKIKVRMQACNIACWTMSTELGWGGDCVQWPIPTVFPLARYCARMASPADNEASPPTAADQGYTYYQHLNSEGATVQDARVMGTDGQSQYIVSPKVCLYWDPWAFDMVPLVPPNIYFDIFDYNPTSQPYHNNGGVHPIIQMIINLLETGMDMVDMLAQLEDKLISSTNAKYVPALYLINKTMDILAKVVDFIGENIFIKLLEEFGQFNHVVYEHDKGCVNVPIGPFPPPYPPTYQPAPPSPKVETLCATTPDYTIIVTNSAGGTVPAPIVSSAPALAPVGATVLPPVSTPGATTYTSQIISNNGGVTALTLASPSTTYAFRVTNPDGSTTTTTSSSPSFVGSTINAPCATSALANNAIRNAVRVGFDNLVPICGINNNVANQQSGQGGSPSPSGSSASSSANACVNISGTLTASMASSMGGIKICITGGPQPCVSTTNSSGQANNITAPSTCGASPVPCKLRLVFATQFSPGGSALPNPYYNVGIPDCNGTTYPCQKVWGINSGPYTDLALKFPSTETTNNSTTLINDSAATTSTLSYQSISHSFIAAIARSSQADATSLSQYNADTGAYTTGSTPASQGVISQNPTQICVYQNTDPSVVLMQEYNSSSGTVPSTPWSILDCTPRASIPTPNTPTDCTLAGSPIACPGSNHFTPAMLVTLQVGADLTQGILWTPSVALSSDTSSYPTSINLAGGVFSSTVTDGNFTTAPFAAISNTTTQSSTSACTNFRYTSFAYTPIANSSTLLGQYLAAPAGAACPGATLPYYVSNPTYNASSNSTWGGSSIATSSPPRTNPDTVVPTGAVYLSGLEYIQGKYLVGGVYNCINSSNTQTCATNTNNCVLAYLLNANIIDCATFNAQVTGKYPNIAICGSTIAGCAQVATVPSAINTNILTVWSCGSSPNDYKCYTYTNNQGGTTSAQLCQPDPNPMPRQNPTPSGRIKPAFPASGRTGTDPTIAKNDYYDPTISISSTMTSGTSSTPPAVEACSSFLGHTINLTNPLNYPYLGIPQCSTLNPATANNTTPLCSNSTTIVGTPPRPFPQYKCYDSTLPAAVCSTTAPIVETIASTITSSSATYTQTLNIRNCYNSALGQNSFCYDPVSSPAQPVATSCVMNNLNFTRTQPGGSASTGSATLSCGSFISLLGSSAYGGGGTGSVAACATPPTGSIIMTLASSTNPSATVNLYQYSTLVTPANPVVTAALSAPQRQLNYCYSPGTANSCTLNRTNTTLSGPSQLDCYTFLSMINSNYINAVDCNSPPPLCATGATLTTYATQNYATSATCTSSTPSCTTEATIASTSPSKTVTSKKCTYNTTVTLTYPNGSTSNTTTSGSYYCYSYSGGSCNIGTSGTTITPGSPAPAGLSTKLPAFPTIPSIITNVNGAPTPPAAPIAAASVVSGVRTKTSLEQGLCVGVPLLTCTAVATADTSNATWTQSSLGAPATGTCAPGYSPPPGGLAQRACLVDPSTAAPGSAPVATLAAPTTSTTCIGACPAITTPDATLATWPTTNVGHSAPGTCKAGYKAPPGGLVQRNCLLQGPGGAQTPGFEDPTTITTCVPMNWSVAFNYPPSTNTFSISAAGINMGTSGTYPSAYWGYANNAPITSTLVNAGGTTHKSSTGFPFLGTAPTPTTVIYAQYTYNVVTMYYNLIGQNGQPITDTQSNSSSPYFVVVGPSQALAQTGPNGTTTYTFTLNINTPSAIKQILWVDAYSPELWSNYQSAFGNWGGSNFNSKFIGQGFNQSLFQNSTLTINGSAITSHNYNGNVTIPLLNTPDILHYLMVSNNYWGYDLTSALVQGTNNFVLTLNSMGTTIANFRVNGDGNPQFYVYNIGYFLIQIAPHP